MDSLDGWEPEAICLSSGGTKGMYILGKFYYFWQQGYLEKLKIFCGSSVGAIILALYASGVSPCRIFEVSLNMTLFDKEATIDWVQISQDFGLVSNMSFEDNMAKTLLKLLEESLPVKNPTLKEFYEITGKHMIYTTVSLKKKKEIYIDHTNMPNLDMLTAMRMSSNSPGVFGKLEFQQDFWVDGAILDPFPIRRVDDGNTQVLALGIQEIVNFDIKMNALSYYNTMISMILTRLSQFAVANSTDCVFAILMPVKDEVSMLDTGNSQQVRADMFLQGYKYAERYVLTHSPKKLSKRPKEMPLSRPVIESALDSYMGKIIVRALEETPELVRESLRSRGVDEHILLDPDEDMIKPEELKIVSDGKIYDPIGMEAEDLKASIQIIPRDVKIDLSFTVGGLMKGLSQLFTASSLVPLTTMTYETRPAINMKDILENMDSESFAKSFMNSRTQSNVIELVD